ncbi:MAG: SDR family oxidoreductase [Deltaproteobacteria bacterium]|nr:SDR family oxidoreductase [Deltaproteobacteria bacterium]
MGEIKVAFLTGATGFLGRHLLRELIHKGFAVRALVRDVSRVQPLDQVEWLEGCLEDPKSVEKGIRGAQYVFHTAALNEFWQRDKRRFYEVNVQGTKNVLDSCLKCRPQRVVYTSSLATLGSAPEGKFIDEQTSFNLQSVKDHYAESKFQAERLAQNYAQKGVPVVILNPTAVIGTDDTKPTPIGKIIQNAIRGKLPFYLPTRINFVDVRDVARMHVVAAERGVAGERYLIGGANLRFDEFLKFVSKYSGKPAPRHAFPIPLVKLLSYGAVGMAYLSGRPPLFSPNSIRMAEKNFFCDCRKAKDALGMVPAPIEQTIKETVEWHLRRSKSH